MTKNKVHDARATWQRSAKHAFSDSRTVMVLLHITGFLLCCAFSMSNQREEPLANRHKAQALFLVVIINAVVERSGGEITLVHVLTKLYTKFFVRQIDPITT